jgi:hypothetical protein
MSRDFYDRMTAPNRKSPGLRMTWRNLRGERPQTAQSKERDRRVEEIRGLLTTVTDLSAAHIQTRYGLKSIKTAETYLAMAKGAM